MTDKQIAFWLITAGVFEIIAIFIAIFVVFPSEEHELHPVLKFGFALMVFGLVVQIIRSVHYVEHGFYPVDRIFPLWLSKDAGACILIFYYAYLHPKLKR